MEYWGGGRYVCGQFASSMCWNRRKEVHPTRDALPEVPKENLDKIDWVRSLNPKRFSAHPTGLNEEGADRLRRLKAIREGKVILTRM